MTMKSALPINAVSSTISSDGCSLTILNPPFGYTTSETMVIFRRYILLALSGSPNLSPSTWSSSFRISGEVTDCRSFEQHLRWTSRSLPSQKKADTRTLVSRTTRVNSFFFFPDLIDRPLDIVPRDALPLGILGTPSQEFLELLLRGHADPF